MDYSIWVKGCIEKQREGRGFGNRGRRWFERKTGMNMGQNGRIKKKRGRKGFGEEDRNGYGSK